MGNTADGEVIPKTRPTDGRSLLLLRSTVLTKPAVIYILLIWFVIYDLFPKELTLPRAPTRQKPPICTD